MLHLNKNYTCFNNIIILLSIDSLNAVPLSEQFSFRSFLFFSAFIHCLLIAWKSSKRFLQRWSNIDGSLKWYPPFFFSKHFLHFLILNVYSETKKVLNEKVDRLRLSYGFQQCTINRYTVQDGIKAILFKQKTVQNSGIQVQN